MKRNDFAWLGVLTLVFVFDGPAAAQQPTMLPELRSFVSPSTTSETSPMNPPAQPGAPTAFDTLQTLGDCPCESPPATPQPPVPPPYSGPLHEREKLFGDWCGLRGALRDHGVTFDIYSTNIFGDLANGGLRETAQYRGRTDVLMNINGEKAGLWKGSFVDLHLEMAYGTGINSFTGALEPVSFAQLVPSPNGYVAALTGVKFTQALSERLIVFGGKINVADNFNQPFSGGARGVDGFLNGGLLFPAVFARTVPYSSWGAGLAYLKGLEPVLSLLVMDANSTPTRDGFDTFFDNGTVLVPQINIPTKFFGLPGHQGMSGSYSTKRYTLIDRTSFINAIVLNQVLPTKAGSWSLSYNFDQAFYVDPTNPKRSWGVFGNLGLADQNPSPFRWFANIGLGGSSMLPGRKLDTFGIGYYYLGLNNALVNLAPRVLPFRDNEQGVELFYNAAVTPWCHITPDMQVVVPSLKRADPLLFFGLRAKIDF